MNVTHMMKDRTQRYQGFRLLNPDGTWNILCETKSKKITATEDINKVTCKLCKKIFGAQQ